MRIIAVSHDNFQVMDPNHAAAHSPKEALLLVQDFSKVIVAGGGILDTSFLEEDLVDEIYLDVEPVVISSGLPLFNGGSFDGELKLLDFKKFGESEIQLHYRVVRQSFG